MPDDDLPNGLAAKPSVLIIGGLGFIGRHLAHHLHTHQLTSHYRIVDKILPQLAHLAPEFASPCSPAHFIQADASRDSSLQRIFAPPADCPDPDAFTWDYVINLGGETGCSQTSEIYNLRTTQLSITLGKEAAKRKVKAFVEVSTGIVYGSNRTPRVESDRLKPWLKFAQAKLDAEAALSRIEGLNLVVLRLAHVYGDYDTGFSSKALCLGRVYRELGKELKWLWTEDLRVNTVWVGDAVRAIWTAAQWRSDNDTVEDGDEDKKKKGTSRRPTLLSRGTGESDEVPLPGTPIFNVVDHGNTSQGIVADIIAEINGIKTGFQGSLISQFARLNIESVVDDLNEEVLQPWAELLEKAGKRQGPLSPFLEKELLKDCDLSLDGGLLERVTGFTYERERLDVKGVREMVVSYQKMGWWP